MIVVIINLPQLIHSTLKTINIIPLVDNKIAVAESDRIKRIIKIRFKNY
jgi:hypothetical protein